MKSYLAGVITGAILALYANNYKTVNSFVVKAVAYVNGLFSKKSA